LSTLGFPSIIVADSSPEEKKSRHRDYIEKMKDPGIKFFGYPQNVTAFEKLYDVLNYVKTPYVVFCSDKDFPIAGGIEQALDFLINNPDYSIADGHYFRTDVKDSEVSFHELYGAYHIPLQSSSSLQRVYTFMSDYFAVFYAVHRTELARKALKKYLDTFKGHYNEQFGELIPASLDLCYGKYRRLDIPYWIRSAGPSFGSATPKLDTYAKSDELSHLYIHFEDLLTDSLLEIGEKSDRDHIRNILKNSFRNYLAKHHMRPECYDFINPDTLLMKNPLIVSYRKLIRILTRGQDFLDRKIHGIDIAAKNNSGMVFAQNEEMKKITKWTLDFAGYLENDAMIPNEF